MYDQRNKIIHHVNLLLCNLHGYPPKDSNVLIYAENLEKSINPRLSSQVNLNKTKQVILEGNPNSDAFLSKYDELKLRNIRELDPFVYLLGKIKREPELFQLINKDLSKERHGRGDIGETEMRLRRQIESSHGSRYTSVDELHGPAGDDTICSKKPHQLENHSLKLLPQWVYERPYLSSDFLPAQLLTAKLPSVLPLETMPLNAQEKLIVQDILSCLQGNDGSYIKAIPLDHKHSKRHFEIDENMHPSLIDTVNKILPLCSNYSLITRFVEEKECYEYGRVNQALTEAIDRLLRDYWLLVCQLEDQFNSNQLGISRLLFLLKETSYLFTHIDRLATNINTGECTGGAVLSLLHESLRLTATLNQVHDCMFFLMRSACLPFFQMLRKWIYRGIIDDNSGEFFIMKTVSPKQEEEMTRTKMSRINQSQSNSGRNEYFESSFYWKQSYAIVFRQLPDFLESHSEKVLKTGKYLNVVQQCDSSFKFCNPEEITFSEDEREFLDQIDRAHSFASKSLLDLIIKQKDLKGILKSVKRYFLLDQGDFIVHFMDSADSELKKPNSIVNTSRLDSLLELALSQSSADADPYKDNLKVANTNCDLITQMLNILHLVSAHQHPMEIQDLNPSGLEAFSLNYQLEWPISLIINGPVMERYQILFRHLFYCRHVERHLSTTWAMRKAARKSNSSAALWFNTAFILVQRMLTFIQHLQYYMTVEVIEPTWLQFFQFLDKADNVEKVLEAHMRCLEACLDDCLLTSPDLLAMVGKLNMVCVNFANFCNKLGFYADGEEFTDVSTGNPQRPLLHHPSFSNLPGSSKSSTLGGATFKQKFAAGQRRDSFSSDADGSSLFRGSASSMSTSVSDVKEKVAAFDLNSVGSQDAFIETIDHFDKTFNGLIVELLIKVRQPNATQRNKLQCLAARLDFNGFYTQYSLNTASGSISDLVGSRDLRQSVSLTSLTMLGASRPLPPPRVSYRSGGESVSDVNTPSVQSIRTSRTDAGRPPLLMDRRNNVRGSSTRKSRQPSSTNNPVP